MAFTSTSIKNLKFAASKSDPENIGDSSATSTVDSKEHKINEFIQAFSLPPISVLLPDPDSNLSYEGISVNDLEQTGIETIRLLKVASNSVIDKNKFNTQLLSSTPIEFILQQLKFEKIKDNSYIVHSNTINIKPQENKWYDVSDKKGNINAISLMKHIIAKREGMNEIQERENDKTLFISACKELSLLQQKISENISSPEDKPVLNNKQEDKQSETSVAKENKDVKKEYPQTQKIDWDLLIKQLESIPLEQILEHIGANGNEDNKRNQWKIWSTGHNIAINGNQWKNWNLQGKGSGGIGGITLVMHHLAFVNRFNMNDDETRKKVRKESIKFLLQAFGSEYDLMNHNFNTSGEVILKEPFCMPRLIPEKLSAVKTYLHEKRFIPNWIIEKQISKGFLFAGYPSDWKDDPALKSPSKLPHEKVWAVMLASNGNAAEMRAIERKDQYAKMLAKGSDKEFGGFLVHAEKSVKEKVVASCEAAIDSMSYHSFFPGRVAMSCMGVNYNLALKAAQESLDGGYKFALAFDNDAAGIEATVMFKEALINELGEDEYKKYANDEKIIYFELGLSCFKESLKTNQNFYFEARNNEYGFTAVKMFQDILFKNYGKDTVNKFIKDGKIKYINIAPDYGILQNPEEEAKKSLSLLQSGKPYYLLLKDIDPEEKEQHKINRETFELTLEKLAGTNFQSLIDKGLIINEKHAIAKDWNEFYIYKYKNDPEFKKTMDDNEIKFSSNSKPLKLNIK